MNHPNLPEPIASYFKTKSSNHPDDVLDCFSRDATVIDDGENTQLTGHDEIRSWLSGTIASYNLTTQITDVAEKEGETIVTALVSGDFPGSPISFDYRFVVVQNKIVRLVIE